MTTELETRLRQARTDAPALAVDEAAVLARGRRLVRARRVGAASVSVLLVVGVFAVARALVPSGELAVPARPPAPVATATSSPVGSVATLELPPSPTPEPGDAVRVRIVVEQGDPNRVRLTYEALAADGRSLGGAASETDSPGSPTWGTGSMLAGIVVGYVGGPAAWVAPVAAARPGETVSNPAGNTAVVTAPDGSPATVFAARMGTASEAGSVSALLWFGADGQVRSSEPTPVSQVIVQGSDGDHTLFQAPGLGLTGHADASGFTAERAASGAPQGGGASWAVQRADGHWLVMQSGQLAPGASGTTFAFTAGADGTRFETASLPDGGGIFWYAEAVVATPTWSSALASLSWVDAAGVRQERVFG